MENILIKAKLAAACWDYKEAPRDIEYFPEGEHTIQCSVNGKPQELTVKIDSSVAEVMQKSLGDAFAQFDAGEASKPFLDFDHEGKHAAAYPRRFFRKDGLWLELEQKGKDAQDAAKSTRKTAAARAGRLTVWTYFGRSPRQYPRAMRRS